MSEKTINDARTDDVVTLHGTRWKVIGFTATPSALLEREGCEDSPVNLRTHHTVCLGSRHADDFKLVEQRQSFLAGFVAPEPLPMERFDQHYSRTVRAMEEHFNNFMAGVEVGKP